MAWTVRATKGAEPRLRGKWPRSTGGGRPPGGYRIAFTAPFSDGVSAGLSIGGRLDDPVGRLERARPFTDLDPLLLRENALDALAPIESELEHLFAKRAHLLVVPAHCLHIHLRGLERILLLPA